MAADFHALCGLVGAEQLLAPHLLGEVLRDIVAAFELAWNRTTPHAEYKPD